MTKRGRKTNKIDTPKANDPKGYLDSNKDMFTDYKVIKGNKITMEGVSGKIYAIPVDASGKAGQGKLLKAGENHEFEGAAHVIEVPEIAMAQLGINTGNNKMNQMGISTAFPQGNNYVGTTSPQDYDFFNDPEKLFTQKKLDGSEQADYLTSVEHIGGNPKVEAIAPIKTAGIKEGTSAEELLSTSALNSTQELEKKYAETPVEDNTLKPTEKIQFDNPYGGVDIPTAAQTLGASLSYDGDQKGMNTVRGVASGLKLLTGLGRNVMSGYAQNKRNQWVVEQENDKQRNQIKGTSTFLQKGGNVKAAELLTGSMVTGNPEGDFNVEVEGGEHIKDNQTGQVQEVIGKKHSQGGEKMNLEDHKVLSDYTKIGGDLAKKYRDEFDIKVKAKDTYATVMDKVLKKTGYKSITDELTATIEKTEKEQEAAKDRDSDATTGINMQHLSGKINSLTKDLEPLEAMKSNVFETLFEDQQNSKPKSEIQEEEGEFQTGGNTEDNRTISRERFMHFAQTARRLGYEGAINTNAENLDAEAAKLQAYMVENHPEIVTEYAKKNRLTAKGLGILKTNSPELFEQAGLDINKEPAQYTDEELSKLSSVAQETGAVDDEFWKSEFNDGLWRYRAPNVAMDYKNNISTGYKPLGTGITAELMNSTAVPSEATDSVTGLDGIEDIKTKKERGEGNGRRTALLPDQHILPPSTMQPHRLGEVTPRESEAKLISPTAQIEEINRQALSAKESINALPDSQRRAALAQLNAQTQQSINQVMSQTNRANAQIEGQNEQANIARGTNADLFNEQAANLHERNMLLAKDNTERDVRDYFNAQNKKQVANYNTINNMNLTNAMYDNFQYDGNGSIIQTGKGLTTDEATARVLSSLGLTEEDLEEAKKRKDKSKKTAKRGRKIK